MSIKKTTPGGKSPQKVVILGSGFGGLYTALHLKSRLKPGEAEIHLVSREDHFLFTPLLHEVAAGLLEPYEVARPVSTLVGKDIEFHNATVESLDLDARVVALDGGPLPYDTLVLALGSEANYYGLPNVQAESMPLKTLDDALKMHDHFLSLFERARRETDPDARRRLLTIVLAGAGCTGVELVSELHHLIMHGVRQKYPELDPVRDIELVVVEASDHVLCPHDEALAASVMDAFRRRHIRVMLHTAVTGREPGAILVKDLPSGRTGRISAEMLIWTAGIQPNDLVRGLPLSKDPRGSLLVDESLQVKGHPDIYALGDCAAAPWEGEQFVPWTAQAALQEARTVAANIVGGIRGGPLVAFRYKHLGEVATLGGAEGVSEFLGLKLRGLPGWLAARMAHLARLPDWSDRVRVVVEWGADFLGPREVEEESRTLAH
jgi:NADH dehydrogenase